MGERAVRKRVVVSGRVQGVWFRGSTERTALSLGVAGWVRNLPDGRVEAAFEGLPDAVDAAVEWARTGPRHARVDDVEAFEEEPHGETGFTVG
jgi:acylphosphatase